MSWVISRGGASWQQSDIGTLCAGFKDWGGAYCAFAGRQTLALRMFIEVSMGLACGGNPGCAFSVHGASPLYPQLGGR